MPTNPRATARALDDVQRQRALQLIRRLRDPKLPDEAGAELLDELEKVLVYPRVSDLIFWRTPELAADEIIDVALRYQPFVG
ncbi:e9imm peptide [Actinoplanes sp. NPDC023936]|uniref:e9imm peptide n=1 Tax=Actinoplanes sp. NPDC023936 TaxID=3154910 RepID=UPI0033F221EB